MTLADPATIRVWFADSAAMFVEVLDQLPLAAADQPGLGQWSVRSLVGHTCRAFTTIEEYTILAGNTLANGGDLGEPLRSAAEYFHAAFASVDDPAAVARRGVAAGEALGIDPFDRAHDIAARGVAFVDALPDDAYVLSPWGALAVPTYLATRAFELSVHTLDLLDAVRVPVVPPLLPGCSRRAAEFAVGLSRDDESPTVLRASTGRGSLPDGFTCLH